LGNLDLQSDTDPNRKDKESEALEGEACALPAQKSKEASAEDKVKQEVSNNLGSFLGTFRNFCKNLQWRIVNQSKVRKNV